MKKKTISGLLREIKHLKRKLQIQNNKSNKMLVVDSVISALVVVLKLLVNLFNK